MQSIPIFVRNVHVFISTDFNFQWKEALNRIRGPHVPRNALPLLTISVLMINSLRKALQVYMTLVIKKEKNVQTIVLGFSHKNACNALARRRSTFETPF